MFRRILGWVLILAGVIAGLDAIWAALVWRSAPRLRPELSSAEFVIAALVGVPLIWFGLLLLKSVERGVPRANRGSLLALAILGWGSFAVGAAIVFAGMFAGDYLTVIIAAVLFGAVGFVLRRASARGRPLPLPPPPPPLVPN